MYVKWFVFICTYYNYFILHIIYLYSTIDYMYVNEVHGVLKKYILMPNFMLY